MLRSIYYSQNLGYRVMDLNVRVMNLCAQDKSARPQFAVTLRLTQFPLPSQLSRSTRVSCREIEANVFVETRSLIKEHPDINLVREISIFLAAIVCTDGRVEKRAQLWTGDLFWMKLFLVILLSRENL